MYLIVLIFAHKKIRWRVKLFMAYVSFQFLAKDAFVKGSDVRIIVCTEFLL